MNKNQRGFAHVEIIIVLVVILIAGLVGWRLLSSDKSSMDDDVSSSAKSGNGSRGNGSTVSWNNNSEQWVSSDTPPACQDPLTVQSPVDMSKATAVLYPGQYRGGNYKSHGGFIFRGSANDSITIKVPQDSIVHKGSRYVEMGEMQYMFVLIAPCGIMYRFDHLAVLSPSFQKLADSLPAAKVDDSRTTNFADAPTVKAGDTIATTIGFTKTNNTSVDFGVYDLRTKNEVSKTVAWQKEHPMENEFGAYAICWLDNLAGGDKALAQSLPGGDGQAGKQSDYCH